MKTVKVNIAVNGETEKAYSTFFGWIPKSAVSGTLSKYNKTTDIVEIASWLVSKNEAIQENAKQAKIESDNFNMVKFGTITPKLRDVIGAISDREEENGNVWNPLKKEWVKNENAFSSMSK